MNSTDRPTVFELVSRSWSAAWALDGLRRDTRASDHVASRLAPLRLGAPADLETLEELAESLEKRLHRLEVNGARNGEL